MNLYSILVIDDEPAIRKLLEITLQAEGYKVILASGAKEGELLTAMQKPDMILLDLGLPDNDGQNALRELREWYSKPIIILSARHAETEIIKALDNGANDYLIKPFRTGELLARIRCIMRMNYTDKNEPLLNVNNLTIDFVNRTIYKDGELVKLTTTEYALFMILVKNEGKVLTHAFILKEIWGPGYTERSEYPRVFIGQLRKKLENNPNKPTMLLTESGVGYRFVSEH